MTWESQWDWSPGLVEGFGPEQTTPPPPLTEASVPFQRFLNLPLPAIVRVDGSTSDSHKDFGF